MGVGIGHFLLAYKITLQGIGKLQVFSATWDCCFTPTMCMIILLLFFKIFWLFYYYFAFFWFNRGYSVNDRLYFILTVIKQDYNTNDGLKFILSFIR